MSIRKSLKALERLDKETASVYCYRENVQKRQEADCGGTSHIQSQCHHAHLFPYGIGGVFQKAGIMEGVFADKANQFVFKVALPVLLFEDLSNSDF